MLTNICSVLWQRLGLEFKKGWEVLYTFSTNTNTCFFFTLFEQFSTHNSTPECHQVWKSIDPFNFHHPTAIHPSSTSTWMCICCNPGSVDPEQLGLLKHLWGATEQWYGSPSGTNSPRSCTLSPDQWTWSSLHTLFTRTAATDFFLPLLLPQSSRSPLLGLHYTCLFTWLRVQGKTGAGRVYWCAVLCVWTGAVPSGQSLRLSLCTGRFAAMLMLMHSQWPQLRSQCCAS